GGRGARRARRRGGEGWTGAASRRRRVLPEEGLIVAAVLHRRAAERGTVLLAVERRDDRDGRHGPVEVNRDLGPLTDGLREHRILHQHELAGGAGRVRVLVEAVCRIRRPARTGERDGHVARAARRRDAEAARPTPTRTRALRVAGASRPAERD